MFCPSCGNKIDPTKKFCEHCGSPIDASAAEPEQAASYEQFPAPDADQNFSQQPANNMQIPFSAPQPPQPENNPVPGSFPANNAPQPVNKSYSGTMPITNGSRPDSFYDLSYPAKTKKSSAKTFLIIAIVALLVAVIGVTAFFLIRKKIDRDYIINNPTKSTLSSYEKFVEENESGSPFYSFFKNARKSGTVTVTASGNVNMNGQTKDVKASACYGYDVNNYNYYFKLDAADMLVGLSGSDETGGLLEADFNKENLYFNFDLFGSKGKFYIDNKNFREDINNSIFSPDKDNILGLPDKKSFDKFIDSYEKAIEELGKVKDSGIEDGQLKKSYDNMIKIIEEKGSVKVDDGNAELTKGSEKTTVSADVITYTYDKKGFKALVTGIRDELKNIINSSGAETKDSDSMDESFKQFLDSFENNSGDNFKLTVTVYLDKNTHSALKTTIDMTGVNKDSDNSLKADMQFFKAPDNLITVDATVKSNGTENKFNLKLKKTDDKTTIKYDLDANSSANSKDSSIHASLEYNRSSGDFTVSAGLSDQGAQFSYKGKLEISDTALKLKLPDIYKNDSLQLSLDIDYSNKAPAKPDVSDAKNLLKLSKDEFTNLFSGAENTISALTGRNTPIDYDSYDYGGDNSSLSNVSYISDASSIDTSLKSFYAGVISGTITSKENPKYPEPGSSIAVKKEAAKNLTIGDALEYNGLESLKDTLYRFGADSEGNVFTIYDTENYDKIVFYFDSSTKLGDIYK